MDGEGERDVTVSTNTGEDEGLGGGFTDEEGEVQEGWEEGGGRGVEGGLEEEGAREGMDWGVEGGGLQDGLGEGEGIEGLEEGGIEG